MAVTKVAIILWDMIQSLNFYVNSINTAAAITVLYRQSVLPWIWIGLSRPFIVEYQETSLESDTFLGVLVSSHLPGGPNNHIFISYQIQLCLLSKQ